MSAMTGPRHSPSSTWQHNAQNQPFAAAASVRTPTNRLPTPHLDSASSPNYFSISVNNQSGLHDSRQGLHATNEKGTIPHAQSSIHGQRPQILPRMSTSESSIWAGSLEADSGSGMTNASPKSRRVNHEAQDKSDLRKEKGGRFHSDQRAGWLIVPLASDRASVRSHRAS